jgi:hypothetical protein
LMPLRSSMSARRVGSKSPRTVDPPIPEGGWLTLGEGVPYTA